MSTNVTDRTRIPVAATWALERIATAVAGVVVAGATYWMLSRYGALLVPNPEAAAQMFSP